MAQKSKTDKIAASQSTSPAAAWEHLQKLIGDTQVAMLTTVENDHYLRSRPMMTQSSNEAGVLWFFTEDHDGKAGELELDPRVNLSYSKPESQQYVSVSGLAEVVHDEEKKQALWKPAYKAWFPEGVDAPHLALLKVYIEKAEFWDAPASAWVEVVGFAKALLSGKRYKFSKQNHDTIDLSKNPGLTDAVSSPS